MSDVEQVYPDLYVVKHEMRKDWFCSVLVFLGETSVGLVDTGFPETIENLVFPLIQKKGRNLDEITLVVNTHRDGDHIKGNPVLREHTDAVFAAHRLEADAIPEVDHLLEDGDTVKLGDRAFKVIHTPGHRPGAICLLEEKTRLLITDDVVCGTREDLIRMGKEPYIKSLEKLKTLDAETMIMSHPFQPAGKNILKDKEINEMLRASIKLAMKT
jgi:glyoxylase-like metal-dependent hydrolase (beta-lactamase superfamily II)